MTVGGFSEYQRSASRDVVSFVSSQEVLCTVLEPTPSSKRFTKSPISRSLPGDKATIIVIGNMQSAVSSF